MDCVAVVKGVSSWGIKVCSRLSQGCEWRVRAAGASRSAMGTLKGAVEGAYSTIRLVVAPPTHRRGQVICQHLAQQTSCLIAPAARHVAHGVAACTQRGFCVWWLHEVVSTDLCAHQNAHKHAVPRKHCSWQLHHSSPAGLAGAQPCQESLKEKTVCAGQLSTETIFTCSPEEQGQFADLQNSASTRFPKDQHGGPTRSGLATSDPTITSPQHEHGHLKLCQECS